MVEEAAVHEIPALPGAEEVAAGVAEADAHAAEAAAAEAAAEAEQAEQAPPSEDGETPAADESKEG
jgi:large subunit ribosomal protein L3